MTAGDNTTTNGKRHWLVFVCVLAALTHGIFYLAHQKTSLSPDEAEYVHLGISLAQAGELRLPSGELRLPSGEVHQIGGEVAKRMPLYPTLIAVVCKWVDQALWQNSILAYQTFLAWCATILLALTAERLADGRAGWIVGTIAALYSPFRFLQMELLTETLLIFLLAFAVFLYVTAGLRTRSGVGKWAGLLGVSLLMGLAVLTRANALLFIVPFAVDAACRRGTAMHRGGRVALVLVPALVCACWWGVRNNHVLGAFTLSTSGGLNFYLGHNPDYARHPNLGAGTDYGAFDRLRAREGLSEVEADRRLFYRGLDFVTANPGQTLANTGRKLLVWLRSCVATSAPSLPLLALGTIAACGWRRWRTRRLTDRRRAVYVTALIALPPCLLYWLFMLQETQQPWTTPPYVVPIGLAALLLIGGGKPNARGLLIGLFASQLLVAVAFIPLTRLRWTVDGILIIAIGVGLSRLCRWLCTEPSRPATDSTAESTGQGGTA